MGRIEWENSLSVGIGLIDKQHRMLIKHLNDMAKAVETLQGPTEIAKTLDFLIDYTDFHFSTEERHMAASSYPKLEEHRARHAEFRNTLDHLGEDFEEEGATQALAESIETLLFNWLVRHIRADDVQFGGFLKSEGVELPETD
jgi:hemerythrin